MTARRAQFPFFCSQLIALVCALSCVTRSSVDSRISESQLLSSSSLSLSIPDPSRFSFAVVGDTHVEYGNTTRLKVILETAKAQGVSFICLLGDIVDGGVETDYIAVAEAIEASGFKNHVAYVLGNHDVLQNGWKYYQKYFGPSYYSFLAGNSKFVVIDTGDGSIGRIQRPWIESELSDRESATHVFLMSHYLPFVPTQPDAYLRIAQADEAHSLMALASQMNVKSWFGGHYHSYAVEKVEGVDYVLAGGGGKRRMPPELRYFFARVDVNGNSVSYQMVPVP